MAESDSPFQYNFDHLSLFSFTTVMAETVDEEKSMQWCIKAGIIDGVKLCPVCSSHMRLSIESKRWRCTARSLHPNGKEVERGLLTGSFLARTKMPVESAVRLLYGWSMMMPQVKAVEMACVCEEAASDWYAFLRVCSQELVKTNCAIGGDGHVVEIDKTSLAKKRKYNRGRYYQEYWLFGGVDRTTDWWFGRVVYNKRTKETLIPFIKEFIKPRTRIISDMFATYACEPAGKLHTLDNNRYLSRMEYTHFRDPVTGAHTNTIEGLWEILINPFVADFCI